MAKRLRPTIQATQRNPLTAGLFNRNVPIGVPNSVSSVLEAAQLKETLEKKFNVNQGGLDQLDTDVCRKNAVSNFTQNLAQQIQLHLNNTNISSNPSKTLSDLQNTRGNIIRMASGQESSKSSTPVTEINSSVNNASNSINSNKIGSVIQSNSTEVIPGDESTPDNKSRSPELIGHQVNMVASSSSSSNNQQRSSVVRSAIENGDNLLMQKNESPDMLTPEGVSSNERRPSKSVISDQMINENDNEPRVVDLPNQTNGNETQSSTQPSALFTNSR